MNMEKITLLIFMSFISFGIFYSCAEHSKSMVDLNDMEENSRYKLLINAHTKPDSLHMAEDKAMLQKAEELFYEGYAVKGERLERIFGKEDLRKRGIPEVYYDVVQKDVDPINKCLDTTSVFWRDLMLEGFYECQGRVFCKKEFFTVGMNV
jgi:hypothetical protein